MRIIDNITFFEEMPIPEAPKYSAMIVKIGEHEWIITLDPADPMNDLLTQKFIPDWSIDDRTQVPQPEEGH